MEKHLSRIIKMQILKELNGVQTKMDGVIQLRSLKFNLVQLGA